MSFNTLSMYCYFKPTSAVQIHIMFMFAVADFKVVTARAPQSTATTVEVIKSYLIAVLHAITVSTRPAVGSLVAHQSADGMS